MYLQNDGEGHFDIDKLPKMTCILNIAKEALTLQVHKMLYASNKRFKAASPEDNVAVRIPVWTEEVSLQEIFWLLL